MGLTESGAVFHYDLHQVTGCLAWHYWREIPDHQSQVVLDEFVVMPNHLHGIMGIESEGKKSVGTLHAMSVQDENVPQDKMSKISPESGSLSAIIRSYKSAVTKWCNANEYSDFAWQSRFYNHIIRNEKSLNRIREYIYNNPLQWHYDQENTDRVHEQAVEYMVAED